MLPLGQIELRGPNLPTPHACRFTPDEQVAFMTLCAITRSPLMFGGHTPSMDAFTLHLLTNPEMLAVNQASHDNRLLFTHDGHVAWCATPEASQGVYLALFNLTDESATIEVPLVELAQQPGVTVRDLWTHENMPPISSETISLQVPAHGARLVWVGNY